jgi:nucleotide-binding universal stress UspA family protein
MPTATYDLSPFGQEQFGNAALGDQRRTRSLIDLGNRLARHPQGSLPHKAKNPNALRRLYDLMNTDAVTHAAVLASPVQRCAQSLLAHQGVVLLLHDTTELDFSTLTSLEGQLGQIGNGLRRGYLCHNSLAVLPGGRDVLGLLAQQLHVRADAPEGETMAQRREREDRETLLWPHGAEAADRAVAEACRRQGRGGLPDTVTVVDVCDRAGDTFEMLDAEDFLKRRFVIRSNHNRAVYVGHEGRAVRALLHDHLRLQAEQGRRRITVHGRDGQPNRPATVAISWVAVQVPPPHQTRGHYRRGVLKVWAVRVWEVGAPAGVEAVEWFLLTNVAVPDAAAAWERVDWYCTRWVVEEYHKAQKTGCDIEAPQFTTAEALWPTIALLSVVAVSLLQLRVKSRDPAAQARPASAVVTEEEVAVLSGWRYGEQRSLTVREFFQALARLGGHQNRRRDAPPGWLVLWRGWQSLQLMVQGARASQTPRVAQPTAATDGRDGRAKPRRE